MRLLFTLFVLICLAFNSKAQIAGSVFRVFNGNGVKDTSEPFVPGVIVNAYLANSTTTCGTTMTSGNTAPNYTLSGCGTAAVRVEFVVPASGVCVNSGIDFSSFAGSANNTSVQFVNGNSTNVNFALHNPSDYNQGTTDVAVFIPCYTSGDPTIPGAVADADWFVSYPYTNSGNSTTTPPTQKVGGAVIGPIWGVAYSKQSNKIFTSALLKRHVGLGSLGSGGIYMLTPTATSFTVNAFYDMDANGHRTRAAAASAPTYGEGTSYSIAADNSTVTYLGSNDPLTGKPAGLGVIGTNIQRGLTSDPLDPSYDPAAFDQVGKVGLGDIDISDDGKFLFVMNLYSRKVFRLELNSASNPTSIINVTSYDVPATTCANGEYRPWGLKFFRNKLYVGVVCSGENGGAIADVNASVYELNNPTAAAVFNASALVTVPLDYARVDDWHPWTNNSESAGTGANPSRSYATPLLSDIEFTDNGDIVMGFMDRSGHQWGEQNRRYLRTEVLSVNISTSGDVLLAGLNCSTGAFALENDGSVTSINGVVLTGSSNLNEGPGGKEFYNDNSASGDPHDETTTGAIGVLKGFGEIMISTFAQNSKSGDSGTMRLSTTNGSQITNSYYELYNRNAFTGVFAKANGLGDIVLSGIEAPIEIGNRIWKDTDLDGIQDAGEAGINGVEIELYEGTTATGSPVQTVTSATVNGQVGTWFFTNLKANQAYVIKVKTALGAGALAACTAYSPTGAGTSLIDNNTSNGTISLTTGNAGENNHTYDIGVTNVVPCSVTLTATPGACVPATNLYQVTGSLTFANAPITGTLTVSVGGQQQVFNAPFTSPQAYTIIGLTSDGANKTVTAVFSATPACTNTATYTAPASCTVAPVCSVTLTATPGACVPATNLYQVTGSLTFANAPSTGTLTVSTGGVAEIFNAPFTTGQAYTLTGLTPDGANKTVTAVFSATPACTNTATYTAPASCAVAPVCSVTLTATPGACVPAANLYQVTGSFTFANAPSTGTLTVSTGGVAEIFNAPFTTGQAYTLTGLTPDGANKTVTAVFSASPACSNTAI